MTRGLGRRHPLDLRDEVARGERFRPNLRLMRGVIVGVERGVNMYGVRTNARWNIRVLWRARQIETGRRYVIVAPIGLSDQPSAKVR
jgi:hypothetical protein